MLRVVMTVTTVISTFVCCVAAANEANAIRVGKNVQVSASFTDIRHNEVIICAHPDQPDRLLAVSHFFPLAPDEPGDQVVAYLSKDGGRTWDHAVDTIDVGGMGVDPDCAFSTDGSVYFTMLWVDRIDPAEVGKAGADYLLVLRSMDSGDTWQEPVAVSEGRGVDRPYVIVDNTGGKNNSVVYMNGNMLGSQRDLSGARIHTKKQSLFRSSDHGGSFQAVPERYFDGDIGGNPSNLIILGEGRVGWLRNVVRQTPSGNIARELMFVSSADGLSIDDGIALPQHVDPISGFASLTVDESDTSPFQGRIYAVWAAGTDLVLTYTDDDGESWSPIRVVEEGGVNGHSPNVEVNGVGVVAVSWYDMGKHGERMWNKQVRFAASLDGGRTFSPPVLVNRYTGRKPTKVPLAGFGGATNLKGHASEPGAVTVYMLGQATGHTAGLTATADGAFHPLWIDTRTGVPQVWTARVEVPGSATQYGAAELEGYEDLSDAVTLVLQNVFYDTKHQTLTAEAVLENTTDAAVIRGLALRALALGSDHGDVRALNADNGIKGPGAIWHIDAVIPEEGLRPGTVTDALPLKFELHDESAADYPGIPLPVLQFQIVGISDRSG